MRTTPAMDTALQQERVIWFLATRIDAKVGAVARLLDGASEVDIGDGGIYTGTDPVWGALDSIDNIGDGVDEQAPAINITVLPNETADVTTITSPDQQGSRTRIWLGVLDVNTKAVVASPYLLFDGAIDVPTFGFDENGQDVNFDVISYFELLFLDDEGSRLNPANHKFIWPGETGLDDVTGITQQKMWGPGDKIANSAPGNPIVANIPGGGSIARDGSGITSGGGAAGWGGGGTASMIRGIARS